MHRNLLLLGILAAFPAFCFQDSGYGYSVQGRSLALRRATVRVIDYAALGPEQLQKASSIAAAIFLRAGVPTEWLPCAKGEQTPACTSRADDADLVVKILAPGMEDPRISDHLLGTANRDTSVAFVFYGHVKVSKLAGNCHESELLASVMAHEVGHLLGLEHFPTGIMREGFRPMDIEQVAVNCFTFTHSQAVQARTAISARLERTKLALATQWSDNIAAWKDRRVIPTHGLIRNPIGRRAE